MDGNGSEKGGPGALPLRKKLAFAALTSLLAFVILISAAEVYVCLAYPLLDLDALTGRKAGLHLTADWAWADAFCAFRAIPGEYGRVGKRVNSHGFISTPEIALRKEPGTIRVVYLGGSSTAGTGKDLADEKTWPWQTTEMLRDALPDRSIEFINGALGGYSSFESYGRLWARIRFFEPDIVVLDHGWNEMYYFTAEMRDRIDRWRTIGDGGWGLEALKTRVRVLEPKGIDPWIGWSQLLTRLRVLVSEPISGEVGPRRKGDPLSPDWDRRGLEVWRTHLRLFDSLARICDFDLFVAKQPTLIVEGLSEEEQEEFDYHHHGFDHEAHVEAYREIYRVIDEEIPPGRVIDLTPLSGIEAYFLDQVHPSEEGAEKIAEIVSRVVAEHLR